MIMDVNCIIMGNELDVSEQLDDNNELDEND
jgi:hypothetical protein